MLNMVGWQALQIILDPIGGPFSSAFIEACQQVGISENLDYNGKKQKGASFFQFNIIIVKI